MKGLIACPTNQLPEVLEITQPTQSWQTAAHDTYREAVGLDTAYRPCIGSDADKFDKASLVALAEFKNKALRMAREGGYEWLFIVDSDCILHPLTVERLIATGKTCVSALYWTYADWINSGKPRLWPNAMPSADRSYECWAEWADALEAFGPGLYPVGLTGATLLLQGDMLQALDPWTPTQGWGEDTWLASYCFRAGITQWTLAMGDDMAPYHIYSPELTPAGRQVAERWSSQS